ncbi:transcription termination factor 2-like isoform X2 [Microplitis mediator]|nr:transcription termination factor 2-like isoform X2 [Microplitis mediator]XP_057325202.1 transcription termination factor 2-like isoform X2 [Microplitis mediator]XP_057325203.1 transcription termination factor 2-like isoform X2 [Microplitis mediator]
MANHNESIVVVDSSDEVFTDDSADDPRAKKTANQSDKVIIEETDDESDFENSEDESFVSRPKSLQPDPKLKRIPPDSEDDDIEAKNDSDNSHSNFEVTSDHSDDENWIKKRSDLNSRALEDTHDDSMQENGRVDESFPGAPKPFELPKKLGQIPSDSEDDDDFEDKKVEDSFIGANKFRNRKRINRILSDSEEDHGEDDKDSGRMTPSIHKAIRRSIFNLSRAESNSSGEESEPESHTDLQEDDNLQLNKADGSNGSVDSFSEDEECLKVKGRDKKKLNDNSDVREENSRRSDSTFDDSFEEQITYDEKNLTNNNNVSKKWNQSLDSNADVSHGDQAGNDLSTSFRQNKENVSSVELSYEKSSIETSLHDNSIDSTIDQINDQNHVKHNESKIEVNDSVHQEEIIIIDSDKSVPTTEDEQEMPPKKTLPKLLDKSQLKYEIERLTKEIERTKQFLLQGNIELLPDKGKKLKMIIFKNHESIAEYQRQLEQIQETEENNSSSSSLHQSHYLSSDNENSMNDSNYVPHDSPSPPKRNSDNTTKFNRTKLLKPTADTSIEHLGKKALETFRNEQALTVERLEHLHGSLISRPTENERAEDPRGLVVPLMPHQQHALAWLLWRETQKPRGGVLADDMGLGKTLTMISLVIKTLAEASSDDEENNGSEWMGRGRRSEHPGGTLVVCPASLINQWKGEVDKRCKRGVLTVEVYHGTNREKAARRLARNDMVITTYNILSRECKTQGQIFQIRWKRVILDEAHTIRNHKSQACDAVCKLKAAKRWALTGTPIHNKETDIFAILKFLQCSPFDDIRVWKRWVENKSDAGVERLATVMKTMMLRRTKQELTMKGELESLPEKQIDVIKVSLDKEERLVYDKVMMHSKTIFAQFLHQRAEKQTLFQLGATDYRAPVNYHNTKFNKAQQQLLAHHADVKSHQILVLLLRLRQICCQPALIHEMLDQEEMEINGLEDKLNNDGLVSQMIRMNISISTSEHGDDEDEEEEVGVDQRVVENLLTSENPVFESKRQSSKLRVILGIVRGILDKNEKLIIVSQWTSYLNIIGDCLRTIPGATFEKFTGQVAVKNRQTIVDNFNSKKNPRILLLSLCAGGVGLNLVGGNHLLLVDIHWNPQLESQAQDRIYRFGQKKNVNIYKIICSDTIEERIQQLQEKKMSLADSVLGGTGKVASKLSLDDLKSLFNM